MEQNTDERPLERIVRCTTRDCSTTGGCPFSFTEESEIIQNYGCLPEPFQIVEMRQKHGKTWACHSNPTKPCLGALRYMKKNGMPYKVIDPELLTEESPWHEYT